MLEAAQKFARLEPDRRGYLLHAVWHLLEARLVHATRNTRTILDQLETRAPRLESTARSRRTAFDPALAAWAIRIAAQHVPWRADCLLQAMAASAWLHQHGHVPRFHLGLARLEASALAAHAWLSLDGEVLIGGSAASVAAYVPILGGETAMAEGKSRP